MVNESPKSDETTPTPSFTVVPPAHVGTFGLVIFLIGMTFAFGWLIYGYLIVRRDFPDVQVTLPVWLWLSTFVVLVSSVTLHSSFVLARMNNAVHARRALLVSGGLGYLFVGLQVPGLVELVAAHRFEVDAAARMYRMMFILAGVHAAHMIGGIAYMTAVSWQHRGVPIDASRLPVLRNLCIYWHYMAIMWFVLFLTFVLMRGVRPLYEI